MNNLAAAESPLMTTSLSAEQKLAHSFSQKESPLHTINSNFQTSNFHKEIPDPEGPLPTDEQVSLDEADLEDATEQQEELDISGENAEQSHNQHQVQLYINPEVVSPTSSTFSPQMYEGSEDYLSYFEAKLYLKRNIAFFSFLSLASLTLILAIHRVMTFQNIFGVCYIYLGYCLYDNLKRTRFPRREAWRIWEDYLGLMDISAHALFLVLVNLAVFDVIRFQIYFFAPYLLTCVSYAFLSKASSHTRFVRTALRSLIAVQTVSITLRLTGDLEWDWIFVFVPSWVYLFAVAAFLIAICLAAFESCRGVDQDFNPQPKGLIWHFLYYGLGEVALLLLLGASQAFSSPNGSYGLLKVGGYVCLLVNSFMVYFTAKNFRLILRHVQDFWLSDGTLIEPLPDSNRQGGGEAVNLKVEKKESYFLKLSSTYYRHLDNRTGKKDKQVECEGRQSAPSIEDLDKVNEHSTAGTAEEISEEEDLCYLCCEKKSDAILMNCGHGGVCYECVVPLIKKKNQCMQCRCLVSEIYKVDLGVHDSHMIKTVEISKVVKKV